MHVRFMHIKNSMTATLGVCSSFALNTIGLYNRIGARFSLSKQQSIYKDSVATNGPFGKSICYLSVGL